MQSENPAQHLHQVLERVRDANPAHSCRSIWSAALGTGADHTLLTSRLGKLMTLPQQALELVRETHPDMLTTCNYWVTHLNAAFMNQNVGGKWETFSSHVDGVTYDMLKMTASFLGRQPGQALPNQEAVLALRDRFQELLNEVRAAPIDARTRHWIVSYLRKIIIAIDEFEITGADTLQEVIDATIGHIAVDDDYKKFVCKTELGTKVSEALAAAANVVGVLNGIPTLTATVQAFATLLS